MEESRNRLESMSDAVLEIAISKAKDPELIKKLRKEAERRGYSFPVPGQSIGEWADEIQVAAYEEEPEQSLEPILPYLERIYPYVVNALLEKDVGDQIYAVMVRNMTQTELELALEAETRPEGLKFLKAEAANRGLIEPEPPAAIGQGAQMVPISLMYPNPSNPRKRFDEEELDKLTASVRQLGVLSPILVVADGENYRIVAGERRYRAAIAAGLEEVPVLIRELTPEQEFEIMLTENLQRADLDPIEEAQAYAEAVRQGWKQTKLAERLGISQAQVANRIRLLELPENIQENISRGIISPSAGRELLRNKQAVNPEIIEKVVKEIAQNRLPVKDIASRIENEVFYASRPLSNVYAHQQNHEVIFDTQLCEKCEKKIMLKRPWAEEKEEPQPRCLDVDCWYKKQGEANQRKDEDIEKELLEKYPDAVVLDEDDMERYAYVVSTPLKEHCKSIVCENFKVARHRGCNWTRDICLDSEMCESCGESIEQQNKQAEETAKNTFKQEKKTFIDDFVLLLSHNEAIFMIMRAIDLSEWSTNSDITKLVCERVGVNYDAIENKGEYEKLPARIVYKLKSLSRGKGVGLLYRILLEVLLAPAEQDDEAWKLTFGADMPEQESEAS